jgi:hypothetical protein
MTDPSQRSMMRLKGIEYDEESAKRRQ